MWSRLGVLVVLATIAAAAPVSSPVGYNASRARRRAAAAEVKEAGLVAGSVPVVNEAQKLVNHFVHLVNDGETVEREAVDATVSEVGAHKAKLELEVSRARTLKARMEESAQLHLTAHQAFLGRAVETSTRRRAITSENRGRQGECDIKQKSLDHQAQVLQVIIQAMHNLSDSSANDDDDDSNQETNSSLQSALLLQLTDASSSNHVAEMLDFDLADALRGYVASTPEQRSALTSAALSNMNATAQKVEKEYWTSVYLCDQQQATHRDRMNNMTREQTAHLQAISESAAFIAELREEILQQEQVIQLIGNAITELLFYLDAMREAYERGSSRRVVLIQQAHQVLTKIDPAPTRPVHSNRSLSHPRELSSVAGGACLDSKGVVCSGHGDCVDDMHACRCDGGWGGVRCGTRLKCGVVVAASEHAVVDESASLECASLPAQEEGQAAATCTVPCAQFKNVTKAPSSPITLSCLSTGSWDAVVPVCATTQCDLNLIHIPDNTHMRCDGNVDGSSCHFRCGPGTVENEEAQPLTITCQPDGTWSPVPSNPCQTTHCNKVEPPDHGEVDCSGYGFGDVCTVLCHPGFELQGPSALTCTADTQWILLGSNSNPTASQTAPVCVPIRCPAMPKPVHGKYECTDGGQSPAPDGNPRGVPGRTGSVCALKCDSAYVLDAPVTRTCANTSAWTGAQSPRGCRALGCTAPPPASNGVHTCPHGTGPGMSCLYSCDTGDESTNSATLTCRTDGTWTGDTNGCEINRCESPPRFTHGNANCQHHVLKNEWSLVPNPEMVSMQCALKCDPGFELVGPDHTTCDVSTGRYDSSSHCKPTSCGDPPPLKHGFNVCNGDGLGSTCRQHCHSGYTNTLLSELRCDEAGKWSYHKNSSSGEALQQSCDPVVCPPLMDAWQCTGTTFGHSCALQCKAGHVQHGAANVVCGADSLWLPATTKPTSSSPKAALVSALQASTITTTTTTTITRNTTTGSSSGVRKGAGGGVCVPDSCAPPPVSSHSTVRCSGNGVNDVCEHTCHAPYRHVHGDAMRTCGRGGEWTGSPIGCEAPLCGSAPAPVAGGEWVCDGGLPRGGFQHLARCELRCGDPSDRTYAQMCTGEGWQGMSTAPGAPKCGAVGCGGSTPRVPRGHVTCPTNAECSVQCEQGFMLAGSRIPADTSESTATIRCDADSRSWDKGDTACVPNSCGAPPDAVGHSSFACSLPITRPTAASAAALANASGPIHHTVGTVCAYVCARDRVFSLECANDKSWLPTPRADPYPPCASKCGKPAGGAGGRVDCEADGEECRLTCKPGHVLHGASSSVCTGSNTFSNPLGSCLPVDCGPPPNDVTNGRTVCTGGHAFDAACDTLCDDGYQLTSPGRLRCQYTDNTGVWAYVGDTPSCEPMSCQVKPPEDPNADVHCARTGTAFTCRTKCREGHVLTAGSSELRVCQADGKWSAPEPACEPVVCKKIAQPDNGRMTCAGHRFGSMCTLTCENSTSIVGEAVRKCSDGAVWTGGADAVCL